MLFRPIQFATGIGLGLVSRAQLAGKDVILKVAKGSGQNHLGEPAWPNEIFYVFPVVIAGASTTSIGLASAEPGELLAPSNAFNTPREILPEWYFLPTFNALRTLENKAAGVISLAAFPFPPLLAPFLENPVAYQNPFRRFAAGSNVLSFLAHVAVATMGAAASIHAAFPWT